MPIRLLIFDLDGTLVDSSVDITNAINYAIDPYGYKHLTTKETIGMVGEGITKLMEKVIAKNIDLSTISEETSITKNLNIDKDILVSRFLEYYSIHLTDNTTVYPNVKEMLERLKDYKKAVVSNKRETLTIKILENLKLLPYFDLVAGSDTTSKRKPSPEPVYYILSKLSIKSAEAAIIGDSNFDIEAGKKAGVKTIAVTYGYRPAELLRSADFLIANMNELDNILKVL